MDSASLERVRRKVESGERLTDPEMELLQRAVHQSGGPSLRLSLAHALLNAEQVRQALGLLEVLRRDHPRDAQVCLALGKALYLLERFPDADRALQDALRLNPNDPEALKALAVLAMRRNEIVRAKLLVDEVLRQDPFDDEAQLLKSELEAAELSGVKKGPVPEEAFVAALLGRLTARSVRHLFQQDTVLVQLAEGGVARVDLASLYATYREESRDLESAVEAMAQELSEVSAGIPASADALLTRVLPVLRRPEFTERAVGAAHREGPAGLLVYYVIDHPELVRYLPEARLSQQRLSLERVDAAAWRNLEGRGTALRAVNVKAGLFELSPTPTGLWALCAGDGYDGARLLTSVREAISAALGPGPFRVNLGRRELTVLCREDDADALKRLEALEASPEGIPGTFRLLASGALSA